MIKKKRMEPLSVEMENTSHTSHIFFQIFTANYDRYSVVKNNLDKPIITRYIRINPETWQGHICMRTEFYGCKKGSSEIATVLSSAFHILEPKFTT